MSESKPVRRRVNPSAAKKVRVWGKGQFTIPAYMRERLGIKENSILEVFQAGRAIIATPEKMLVKELASSVYEEIQKEDINIKELLEELREGNHEYETD
ncbi:MAG: AbrB/MazE/SpoVT family DNA-binding domain-containing protein [Bacillota bacterium]|nr:AbrB/MazE/SpoVT family DNA-binding domain-containing protein [Bacillota bacterium]